MSYAELNCRGSLVWAMDLFKNDALVRLMDDLLRREKKGLLEAQCEHVQNCLGELTNAVSAHVSGGIFCRSLYKEFQSFEQEYRRWNKGPEDMLEGAYHRMCCLIRLRKYRQAIARTMRRDAARKRVRQHVLDNGYDYKALDVMFESFGKLCQALPEVFVNLARAVKRYNARKH